MYHDEFLESKQAPSLSPQIWACDCTSEVEGCFKEVKVTNGQCINCNHYAKRIGTFELARNTKNKYMGPVDSKNRTCADLRKEGQTIAQIATALNISGATVLKWARMKPRTETPKKTAHPLKEKVVALRAQGITYGKIAQQLNISQPFAHRLGNKK